uniref:storkhead-box protein 1-like n=1 Tax=Scatophagus argus TaxID=75038 RepID=UPI001ED7CEF6|nr:storkhead-box protein 1-like [Scatophagus argus]
MEKFLQVAPHSLALVLSQVCPEEDKEDSSSPAVPPVKLQHHSGYEVFAHFKAANMQHFWNKALTHALSEIFFLGWIDERVLLIQGKEVHLQVLRNGWTRRTLKPPQGFDIDCIASQAKSHLFPLFIERGQASQQLASSKLGSSH